MYLTLVFIALINFLIIGCFGRFIGKKGTIIITLFNIFFGFFISIFIFFEVSISHSICHFKILDWVKIGELVLSFGFFFDTITATMCLVVFTISSLVHFYSIGYMSEDPHFIRFLSFLSLFTFFMILVVTADNFIQLFFGWECVGLASYLLINFWYTRIEANISGLKAIIVNKIGDLAIILGLLGIYFLTKSFDYIFVFNYISMFNANLSEFLFKSENFFFFKFNLIAFINIMLLIGVIAKSAQIGLHTWLVDAMEGPTPVSALLHAATMVTVGVFCLIRCNPIFNQTTFILYYIAIIGAITALFGAIVGLLQNDIKRIIAYSTCSQLGYMILSCGLTHYEAALYHLTNHAFFKALLFLTAGGIIHALNGKQDIREMGGMVNIQPILYISFFIGSFALMGLPFFSGFYSKDFIIEFTFVNNILFGNELYIFGIIAALFTAMYSGRLIFLVFFSKPKTVIKINLMNLHKLGIYIYIPLFILSIFSIYSGWLLKESFIGIGTDFFEGPILINHNRFFQLLVIDLENISYFIKIIPNFLTVFGIIISIFIFCYMHTDYYDFYYNIKKKTFNNSNIIFQKKLFFDIIYNNFFVNLSFFISYDILYKLIDRGFFEIIGPYGLTKKIYFFSSEISSLSKNTIYHLIFLFILSIIFLILIIRYISLDLITEEELLLFIALICIIHFNKNYIKNI